jgi:hypothetical protein
MSRFDMVMFLREVVEQRKMEEYQIVMSFINNADPHAPRSGDASRR